MVQMSIFAHIVDTALPIEIRVHQSMHMCTCLRSKKLPAALRPRMEYKITHDYAIIFFRWPHTHTYTLASERGIHQKRGRGDLVVRLIDNILATDAHTHTPYTLYINMIRGNTITVCVQRC